jgi:hypothetical protein
MCFFTLANSSSNTCTPCQDGWKPDFSFFHSQGCTLPTVFYELTFAITFPILILTALFLLNVSRRIVSVLSRNIILYTAGALCGMAILAISSYVQDGMFEGAAIGLIIQGSCTMALLIETWWYFMKPLYILAQKSQNVDAAHVRLQTVRRLLITVFGSICLALCFTCRDATYNSMSFNVLCCVYYVGAYAVNAVLAFFQLRQLKQLSNELENIISLPTPQSSSTAGQHQSIKVMLTRIAQLRKIFKSGYLNNGLALLPLPISYLVIGSTPFQWIALLLVFAIYEVLALNSVRVITKGEAAANNNTSQQQHHHHLTPINSIPPSTMFHNRQQTEQNRYIVTDNEHVGDDTNPSLSVVQLNFININVNDTLYNKIMPHKKLGWNHKTTWSKSIHYSINTILSISLTSLLTISLVIVPTVSIPAFSIVVFLFIFIILFLLSTNIMKKLIKTDFFRLRISASFIGMILLINSFSNDLRVFVPPTLCMLQMLAISSDALLLPQIRSLLVTCALLTTFSSWIVVFFNFAPGLTSTILPIGVQGYSILQAGRDNLLAQLSILLVEVVFVVKGRNKKRFLHLSFPVERILLVQEPNNEQSSGNNTTRRNHVLNRLLARNKNRNSDRIGDASTVFVQSGFVMGRVNQEQNSTVDGNNDNQPKPNNLRVYVNKLVVRHTSSLIFKCFNSSSNLAQVIWTWFDGTLAKCLLFICMMESFIATLLIPFVQPNVMEIVSYLSIFFLMFVIVRQLAMMSGTMLRILSHRPSFFPRLLLVLTWVIVLSVILGDERSILVVFAGVMQILIHDLADADTSQTSSWFFLMVRELCTLPIIVTLSVEMLLDVVPNTTHVTWSMNGGLDNTNDDINSPNVLDAGQLCADFGLFSLALPAVTSLVELVWARLITGQRQNGSVVYFKTFEAPFAPRYVSDDENKKKKAGGEEDDDNDGRLQELTEYAAALQVEYRNNGEKNGDGSVVVGSGGINVDNGSKSMIEVIGN